MTRNHRRSSLYGPLIASLILTLLPLTLSHARNPDLSLIAGVRYNDSIPFGTIGVAWQTSSRMALWTTTDPGKPRAAYSARVAVIVPMSSKLDVVALCGPAIEGIPIDTTDDGATWYLMGATGLAATYAINPNTAIFTAYDYLIDPDHISPHKYAAGVIVRL